MRADLFWEVACVGGQLWKQAWDPLDCSCVLARLHRISAAAPLSICQHLVCSFIHIVVFLRSMTLLFAHLPMKATHPQAQTVYTSGQGLGWRTWLSKWIWYMLNQVSLQTLIFLRILRRLFLYHIAWTVRSNLFHWFPLCFHIYVTRLGPPFPISASFPRLALSSYVLHTAPCPRHVLHPAPQQWS